MRSEESILVRAESDGRLLGAATAHVLDDAAKARLAARFRTTDYPETGFADLRVGELKASAVAPHARRRGIGTALVEARMDFLRDAGCSIVSVASWINPDPKSSSLGLLARYGFEPIVRIRGYWSKGSFTEYPCPDCGLVCLCSAMIMIKDLRQEQG